MAFIEKLDGPALNLSEEEFDGYMMRGRAPSVRSERQKVASDTQRVLEELKGRQEKLDQGMNALNVQLQQWVQVVQTQLDEATSQFAMVQKEIAAQAQSLSTSPHSAASQEDDMKDQTLLVLADPDAGPRDTDC